MTRKIINHTLSILTATLLCGVVSAHAASLLFVPDSSIISEKGVFTGTVYVSSPSTAINAVEGVITFPTNLIRINSVSTADSILSVWVEQPSYNNQTGVISFNGGLPQPGFTGSAGRVIRVSGTGIANGLATFAFSESAVRANDGLGTDVLESITPGSISIGGTAPKNTPAPIPAKKSAPPTPQITSSLASEDEWYATTSASFSWDVPRGVTAIGLVLSKDEKVIPDRVYAPAISQKTVNDLTDGVWYLNARFRTASGWGTIARQKIKIDTSLPHLVGGDVSITEDNLVEIAMFAEDKLSGIDHYRLLADHNEIATVVARELPENLTGCTHSSFLPGPECPHETYLLPRLAPGSHEITIQAFDRAGNMSQRNLIVAVPATQPPVFTDVPQSADHKDTLTVRGIAPYPNAEIGVWVQQDSERASLLLTTAGPDKKFSLTTPPITATEELTMYAEARLHDRAASAPSESVRIPVQKPYYLVFGTTIADVIAVVAPLMIAIGLIIIGIYFIRLHVIRLKARTRIAQASLTEREVHRIFHEMRDDAVKHIRVLERASKNRSLTREEEVILASLIQRIESAEASVVRTLRKPSSRSRQKE